jgi:hypothetical protein
MPNFNTPSGEPYNPPAAQGARRPLLTTKPRTMRDRATAWCLAPAGLPMRLLASVSLLACFAMACTM